jgi:predicted phage terminase large subunit-like protein
MNLSDSAIRRALRDPKQALNELDRAASARSLIEYAGIVWPIIEPATPFVRGRVMEVICEHLEAVTRGQIRRLIVNVPPGTSKSTLTSVIHPTWEWGPMGQPHVRFISWSYADDLSIRDAVKCRRIVDSEKYKALWPHVILSSDQDQKALFETTMSGCRQACGITGATTGYRGDRLLIDDPHNIKDAESDLKRDAAVLWAREILPSRVNNKDSSIVIIAQRAHNEDVCGLYLNDQRWDRLVLPMEYDSCHPYPSRTQLNFVDWRTNDGELLWPERFPQSQVDELKDALGEYAWSSQYQQRPAPRAGGMFKTKDFQIADFPLPASARRIRGWDLAASRKKGSAYTACVLLAEHQGKIVIEDVRRIRGTANEVELLIKECAEEDADKFGGPQKVMQYLPHDPAQAGKAQKGAIARLLAGYYVMFSPETGDKRDRARPFASQVQAGNVSILRAQWNASYVQEMSQFPAQTRKDQVDATTRAYSAILTRRKRRVGSAPESFVGEERLYTSLNEASGDDRRTFLTG